MIKKTWQSTAPSNIALIKYMGKKEGGLPGNPSISYTLPHLVTCVELELSDDYEDLWEPLHKEGFTPPSLDPKESLRFLNHLQMLKDKFAIKEHFIVRSANSFPQNCGLASSASSFAALTKVCVKAFCGHLVDVDEQAALSRLGSGSSCRSFMEPWCMWSETHVNEVKFPFSKLMHMVVVVDDKKKRVSSSKAHERVLSSLSYRGRTQRATIRLGLLVEAMNLKDWTKIFELCWAEFWDMHSLFETSEPSFGYMTQKTLAILHHAKSIWTRISDGPLITMDAGPNVHLLFRPEQVLMAQDLKEKYINQGYSLHSQGF